MAGQTVLTVSEINSHILHIKLNRPESLNALNAELLHHFEEVLQTAKKNSAIKAILLSGTGKGFCAGADIKELDKLDAQSGLEFARHGQKIFRELEQLGKPSLAAVHGFALGGGCELAMSASIRIAAEKTRFGQPEVKLGVIPGFGGTQRLSRLVGKGRALDLCLTGRMITAEVAHTFGLISEVTPEEKLLERAESILHELIKLPPIALKSIMTVIDHGFDLSLDDAFEFEAAHFGICCASADKKEGVNAFLEKRSAEFCGE